MTKLLYMHDINGNYIKEFDSEVVKTKKDYVVLDQTAFYPLGGGQPSDIGVLQWENNIVNVKEVIKKGDTVKHIIDGEKPQVGIKVHAILNWNKRYAHMKMHTAQHIISGIVFDDFNARTVGNQIHKDYSRVDFHPVNFSEKDLQNIEIKFNELIKKNLQIKIYEEQRASLEKRVNQQRANLDLLPQFISKLRIIEIENFDICPCAGTHVKNTSELTDIKIIKTESKGKDTDRIVYTLL
jgi:misacylated tRNA(Ala) deacylase